MNRRQTLTRDALHAAEAWFGADLADIAIHTGPAARSLCASLGARGLALEGQVFLADPSPAVLRHELAHALQQRRFAAGLPGQGDAEGEALLRGWQPGPARAAADPRDPAPWEEVGHYYTAYAVFLAAGVTNTMARKIAFYAQLADEMENLDAKHLVLNYVPTGTAFEWAGKQIEEGFKEAWDNAAYEINKGLCDFTSAGGNWAGCYGGGGRGFTKVSEGSRDYSIMLDVHKGLHALTGEEGTAETKKRLAILGGIDPADNPLAYGLGIHALGDSYAHRDPATGKMFTAGAGHGIKSGAAKSLGRVNLSDSIHVDGVGPSKSDDYANYVRDLYNIAMATFRPGVRGEALQTRFQVVTALLKIVAESDGAADSEEGVKKQIDTIREMARGWGGGISDWKAEAHDLSTLDSSGLMRIPGSGVDVIAADLDRALKIGRHWSQSAFTFTNTNIGPDAPVPPGTVQVWRPPALKIAAVP